MRSPQGSAAVCPVVRGAGEAGATPAASAPATRTVTTIAVFVARESDRPAVPATTTPSGSVPADCGHTSVGGTSRRAGHTAEMKSDELETMVEAIARLVTAGY